MLALALPVLAEQLLVMLVGFSDMVLTGWYFDTPQLAAMGLMNYGLWFLNGLSYFVGIGATAMVARFVGGGNLDAARRTTNQAFLVGFVLAVLLTAAGLLLGERIVWAMQLRGDAADAAEQYLRIVLPVLPAIMLRSVGIHCLRGAGDMVSGLVVMAIVNVVNVAVSWPLVLGLGPLPKLGWEGVAVGTAVGEVVGCLIVLGLLIRGRAGLKLRRRLLSPDGDLIRRLLWIGIPGGADSVLMIGCHLVFLAMINHLGDLAAAAHGVAIRIESLAYLPGTAFQVAAATLAGQYLGAGDPRRAVRSVLLACLTGGGLMVAAGVLFLWQADMLIGLLVHGHQEDVVRTAAPLLRLVALSMPALALSMILSGGLRGAGDTRWPLAFTFIGLVCIRLPGAYLLTHVFALGVIGAWYAMVTDLVVRCLLVVYRFSHGGWKRIEI